MLRVVYTRGNSGDSHEPYLDTYHYSSVGWSWSFPSVGSFGWLGIWAIRSLRYNSHHPSCSGFIWETVDMTTQTKLRWVLFGVVAAILGFSLSAQAATNLVVTCEPVNGQPTAGTARKINNVDTCQKIIYARPKPTSLVRKNVGDTWQLFQTLSDFDITQICRSDIPEGSISAPSSGQPCVSWADVQVSTVIKAEVVNGTGRITLNWDPVTLCNDAGTEKPCNDPQHPSWAIQGYRVFSGTSVENLAPIQTVAANVLSLVLSGYGNGTYFFAVQAFNSAAQEPNGIRSNAASITVQKPTDSSATPVQVQGVVITVTFE